MRLRRGFIAAVLALVVLAGCGAAEKVSPRIAVRDAANATANQKEGTFTLSLVGSDADMTAILNDGQALSEEDKAGFELLSKGHIAVSTASGGKFALEVSGQDAPRAFELKVIDKKIYVRADVAKIAGKLGTDTAGFNQAVQAMSSQEGFGFLAAAAAGKWVVADLNALGDFGKQLEKQFSGGTGTTPSSGTAAEAGRFQQLKDGLGKALSDNTDVKKQGSDSTGDHYVATLRSLRAFYGAALPVLQQAAGGILPDQKDLPAVEEVPDKPADVDVWIKDGRIVRLESDLRQFATTPPSAGRVALRLDISRDVPDVTPPSDAVNVDIAALLGQFFSQFGNMLQGAGAPKYD